MKAVIPTPFLREQNRHDCHHHHQLMSMAWLTDGAGKEEGGRPRRLQSSVREQDRHHHYHHHQHKHCHGSQVELAKKREAAKAAAEQRERQGNRGWLSWAWGGSGGAPQKEGHEEEEDAEMRGELNEEEREALQGLVSEQADALKDGACQTCCCACATLTCPRPVGSHLPVLLRRNRRKQSGSAAPEQQSEAPIVENSATVDSVVSPCLIGAAFHLHQGTLQGAQARCVPSTKSS